MRGYDFHYLYEQIRRFADLLWWIASRVGVVVSIKMYLDQRLKTSPPVTAELPPAVTDINSFENLAARALADTPRRLASRSHYPRRMGAGLAAPSLFAQYRQAPTLAA